eukprot:m.85100 g.85100  ORF g.85100 m.85100 type:complete len:336 (+) comp25830_c0_seq1:166-1173(+)
MESETAHALINNFNWPQIVVALIVGVVSLVGLQRWRAASAQVPKITTKAPKTGKQLTKLLSANLKPHPEKDTDDTETDAETETDETTTETDEEDDDDEDVPHQLSTMFKQASHFATSSNLAINTDIQLALYGMYKQATIGDVNCNRPGMFDMTARAKWDAWNHVRGHTAASAMMRYIEIVKQLEERDPTETKSEEQPSDGSMGGPVQSTMYVEETFDGTKGAVEFVKEGNIGALKRLKLDNAISIKDDEGMTLLHWACDRGHVAITELLLQQGADINAQDGEGQTPLHFGCLCDHSDIVRVLLASKANLTLKDNDGCTALENAGSVGVKNLFESL